MWTEENAKIALEDGWLLAFTFDNGKGRGKGYYGVYPHGPKLPDPFRAAQYVLTQARTGSKIHVVAMRAVMASRTGSK